MGFIPYKETSIIVKVYTESFGVQSYIENGVRSSKGRNKIALFQPLTLLDLVVYHKSQTSLQRISEIRCNVPFYNIPTDIKKTTLGIFVSEVLNLTLREHTENPSLFGFLWDALLFLENCKDQVENFHIYFLLELSAHLGFGIEDADKLSDFMKDYGIIIAKGNADVIRKALNLSFGEPLDISKQQRMDCLYLLIDYYKLNIEDFTGVRSLPVLSEILD